MSELGRPTVTLAFTQTLDGRIAARDGSSQWIGGSRSLVFAHQLRAEHDAIMVGANTVAADNPRLTTRLVQGNSPLRVVVDSRLRIPLCAAVLSPEFLPGTMVATTGDAPASRLAAMREIGANVVTLPDENGRVDLAALLAVLYERGVRTVMVEGGAALLTSLLHRRLADRIAVTVAPKLLGTGIEAIGDLGIARLAQAVRLVDVRVDLYEPDWVVQGRIEYEGITDD